MSSIAMSFDAQKEIIQGNGSLPSGLSVGEKLKSLRQKKGLTLVELSKEIGVSKSILGYYETGKRYPSSLVSLKLAEFYDVAWSDIFNS